MDVGTFIAGVCIGWAVAWLVADTTYTKRLRDNEEGE